MPVMRVHKSRDYTVMSNTHLRDRNLTLKAKGLLTVMLSLPDDWDYSINGLVAICKENNSAVESALKELKENSYLIVTKKMPNETLSGRIEYEYNIYESPQDAGKLRVEKQGVEKQGVEKQVVEKQGVENSPQLNTYESNKKELNTQKLNKDDKTYTARKETAKPSVEQQAASTTHKKYDDIILYLNQKAGTRYRASTPKTQRLLHARLSEGFSLEDFQSVIDKKCAEWNGTEMAQYLRPETLFGTKFESYLNAPVSGRKIYGANGIEILTPADDELAGIF